MIMRNRKKRFELNESKERTWFLSGIFLVFFLLVSSLTPIFGEEVFHPAEMWGAHPPVTWELLSAEPMLTSFSDVEGRAIFQVFTFPNGLYTSAERLGDDIFRSLGAHGDGALFSYTTPEALGAIYRGEVPGRIPGIAGGDLAGTPAAGKVEALFSEMSWTNGRLNMHGYGVFIPGDEESFSYAILSYSLAEFFDVYHDFLLSNLDSFHPWLVEEDSYLRAPGPVSQFFANPVPLAQLNGEGRFVDSGDALFERGDATQVVIDREARILSQYQDAPSDVQLEAWRRFYQLIYRDSFADLAGKALLFYEALFTESRNPLTWPARILATLQGFDYRRTGTLSDLEAPQLAILDQAGDCDTLVLMYLAVLDHLGIDGIIMVSPRHRHSLAGVGSGVQGPRPEANARFPFDGESWLVAELTHRVDLGLIAADMADPADWIGFHLGFRP
jgi:hypothetical protein